MKTPAQGLSVGVVGAASLLGKELLAVLKERSFPVGRLITAEDEEVEPDMPVVDLREGFQPAIADEDLGASDFDVVFVAAPLRPLPPKSDSAAKPPFLRSSAQLARATRCTVIDLCEGLAGEPGGVLSVPFLEHCSGELCSPVVERSSTLQDTSGCIPAAAAGKPVAASPPPKTQQTVAAASPPPKTSRPSETDCSPSAGGSPAADNTGKRPPGYYVSPHPATIVLSGLLLRLAERFTLTSAVAEVFAPASEIGPQAVDELQRQTSSLLSFQKLPQAVFGRQLAFNLLPRFCSGGVPAAENTEIGQARATGRSVARGKATPLEGIESRIHRQMAAYLGERVLRPAVRLFQAPVFHSLALSLYVETAQAAPVEAFDRALAGERIAVARRREPAPSQAEASGSSNIQVDAVVRDASRPQGAWIWAIADNLHLAAVNAIEIAESARGLRRAQGQ